jgi:cation:H+ antiporter
MTVHPAIVFLGGLVVIVVGAELVLRGASRIAAWLGLQPIVIGLTVVALGTSAPELAVGITAAVEGRGALAVGNIAGTNIVNILLILGLSAALRPMPLRMLSIRLDVPSMIGAAVVVFLFALDGLLSRGEGILLLTGALIYTVTLVRMSKRESADVKREIADEYGSEALGVRSGWVSAAWSLVLFITGLALTVLGADLLVVGAVSIAQGLGVSDAIIGLTIVAIGTSMPELATTVVATLKDERDVAIGNLIGSSISNLFVILGVTCLVSPSSIEVSADVLWIDLPLCVAVAVACLPVFRSGQMVSRREGSVFVLAYLIYLAVLIFIRA